MLPVGLLVALKKRPRQDGAVSLVLKCGKGKSTKNGGFNEKNKYKWRFLAGKAAMNGVFSSHV